jgi:hypothetical protein
MTKRVYLPSRTSLAAECRHYGIDTMKIQDMRYIEKLYDLLQVLYPRWVERSRAEVRMNRPGCSTAARKRRVVELALDDRAKYRLALAVLKMPQHEPRGSSPVEQIKGRTALLNEKGMLLGGNFGSHF